MPKGPKGKNWSSDVIGATPAVVEIATGKIPVERGCPMTEEDIEWLRRRRVGRRIEGLDAGQFVSDMRDEDDERLLQRKCGDADI